MELSLRSADPADAEGIVQIYVSSWNAGFQSRMPRITADQQRCERWRLELSDETSSRWWLAEVDRKIFGFVGIGPGRDVDPVGWGELDTIAVTPDAWGRGVGGVLMEMALAGLREMMFPGAYLWTLSNYPLGERFYAAKGWVDSGVTRADGSQVRYDIDL